MKNVKIILRDRKAHDPDSGGAPFRLGQEVVLRVEWRGAAGEPCFGVAECRVKEWSREAATLKPSAASLAAADIPAFQALLADPAALEQAQLHVASKTYAARAFVPPRDIPLLKVMLKVRPEQEGDPAPEFDEGERLRLTVCWQDHFSDGEDDLAAWGDNECTFDIGVWETRKESYTYEHDGGMSHWNRVTAGLFCSNENVPPRVYGKEHARVAREDGASYTAHILDIY